MHQTATAAVLGLFLATTTAHAEPGPQVRYQPNQITVEGNQFIVKGGVRITSPPHRWYHVYFELRLGRDTPLLRRAVTRTRPGTPPGSRLVPIRKHWGMLFMPSNTRTAHWTDMRLRIHVNDLEQAARLPAQDKTLRLQVVCRVWDPQTRRFLGSDWESRHPLLLTRAAQDKYALTWSRPRYSPQGTWTIGFPGGKLSGACTFRASRWSWKIYQGTERRAASSGRFSLGRTPDPTAGQAPSASAGPGGPTAGRLTLTHTDGRTQSFEIRWVHPDQFILTRGNTRLVFTRS